MRRGGEPLFAKNVKNLFVKSNNIITFATLFFMQERINKV